MRIKNLSLILIFLSFLIKPVFANFDVNARTAIVQDYLSGKILYEKDADRQIFPASMTKIMTSIIAFDLIKSGDLNLDRKISEIGGKKIYVKFDQYEILLNLNVNIFSNGFNKDFSNHANNVEIKFLDNQDNFADSEWNSLYKLAENTFVEESDSLKQSGAGAGLTDND